MKPIFGLYRKLRYPPGYKAADIPQGILITHEMPPPNQPQSEIYVNGKNVVTEYEEQLAEEEAKKAYAKQLKMQESVKKQQTSSKSSGTPMSSAEKQIQDEAKQTAEADAEQVKSITGQEGVQATVPVTTDPSKPPVQPGTTTQPQTSTMKQQKKVGPGTVELKVKTPEIDAITKSLALGWQPYATRYNAHITPEHLKEAKYYEYLRRATEEMYKYRDKLRTEINKTKLFNSLSQYILDQTDRELTQEEFNELIEHPLASVQKLDAALNQTIGDTSQNALNIDPSKNLPHTEGTVEPQTIPVTTQTTHNQVPTESLKLGTVDITLSKDKRGHNQWSKTMQAALEKMEQIFEENEDIPHAQQLNALLHTLSQSQQTWNVRYPLVSEALHGNYTPNATELLSAIIGTLSPTEQANYKSILSRVEQDYNQNSMQLRSNE